MKKFTIILLNLRFSDFYSEDLFKQVKELYAPRIIAVLDQHFKARISNHVLPYLDDVFVVPSEAKDGFLAEFNFEKLCDIVENELLQSNDIRIVCTDEFNLLHAGKLRRKYQLPGNTDLDMLAFRDKAKMKEILLQAGIRAPHFKHFEQHDNFATLSESIGLPFVIKPVDSCGSFGVYIIHNQTDYEKIEHALKETTAKFEVEEYIEGKLYHVDSYTKNNKIEFICANEYSWPNFEYTEGKILSSIYLDNTDELAKSLIQFAKKALSALGSKNLVNHMEIFITHKKELVFLEVSARPPGALINVSYPSNHCINLMDKDFMLQTGLDIPIIQSQQNKKVFWAIFPLLPGKIKKFNQLNVESHVDIRYFRQVDDTIHAAECDSIVGKMAHAVFYHEDEKILRKDFEYIRHFVLANMEK